MRIKLKKDYGVLIPADEESELAIEKLSKEKTYNCEIKEIRNYKFHKKWFALLQLGFENWDPAITDEMPQWGEPVKNFDRFRKDIVILTGRYERKIRVNGDAVVEAKSVSFGRMTADEFEGLYSDTIDVLLKYIYGSNMSEKKLRELAEKYLQFA